METVKIDTIYKGVESVSEEIVYNVYDFPMPMYMPKEKKKKGKRYIYNYAYPAVFDIETTSIRLEPAKESYAFMYHWQMCVAGQVVFGRTWDEFKYFMQRLHDELHLDEDTKLYIYVHNLGFEWQFMNQFLYDIDSDMKAFYAHKRTPLFVRMNKFGVEWRCSWKLSNMSAEKYIINSESKYVKQTKIPYDYSKIRTPNTQLNMQEKAYCFCDVRGIYDAIRRECSDCKLNQLPLTSTGFVRRDTLKAFNYYDDYRNGKFASAEWVKIFRKLPFHDELPEGKKHSFRNELLNNKLDEEVYTLLREASRGGDTHANMMKSNKVLDDVYSFDRVSSYPAVQMTKKYPMGRWVRENPKGKEGLLNILHNTEQCTILRIYLSKLVLKENQYCPYIAKAKCISGEKIRHDNGRVYFANKLCIAVTEIDWEIIESMYDFEIEGWEKVYTCRKEYLPIPIRAVNYYYFMMKCALKHGDAYLYMKSKNKLNAIFGMTFTNIVHDKIDYDIETCDWHVDEAKVQESIDKYYENMNSCLRYDWGVYTTAWARYELHLGKQAVGSAFDYGDTDSIKWETKDEKQKEEILAWFAAKNEELKQEAIKHGAYYDNGKEIFYLGIWECEGSKEDAPEPLYNKFKTLGAKKYAYEEKDGAFGVTVAGLNKKKGAEFFKSVENFNENVEVDMDSSGRTISVWRDEPIHLIKINGCTIEVGSSVAVLNTTYTLDMSSDYRMLVKSRQFDLK